MRRLLRPILGLVVLVGCGGSGSSPATTATTPTSGATTTPTVVATTRTTPTTIGADRYRRFDAPSSLGKGLVVGASPDGSAVYVEVVDATLSKRGCEGQLDPVLFRVALAGGGRQPVMMGGKTVQGTLARSPGGRVVITSGCEEFTSAVIVGTETPDGQFRDLRAVPTDATGSGLRSVSWSADAHLLVATRNPATRNLPSPVVLVDATTGAETKAFEVKTPQIAQVGQLTDGTYVVAADNKVTLRDGAGAVRATADGSSFVVGNGLQVLAYGGGTGTVTVISPDRPSPRTVVRLAAGLVVTDLEVSPDGQAVAFTAVGPGTEELDVATTSDGRVTTILRSPQRTARPAFLGDGRGLAFNLLPGAPAEPEVDLVRFTG